MGSGLVGVSGLVVGTGVGGCGLVVGIGVPQLGTPMPVPVVSGLVVDSGLVVVARRALCDGGGHIHTLSHTHSGTHTHS